MRELMGEPRYVMEPWAPGGLGLTGEELRAQARMLYGNGQRAFDAGRFVEALSLFQDAYRTAHEPLVLVAIGATLTAMGRGDEAVGQYRDYLRLDPNGPQVANVRQYLTELAARRPDDSKSAPEEAPVPPPLVSAGPFEIRDTDTLVLVGIAGAGVVAIGIAAWFLSRRKSRPNRRRRS